MEGFQRILVGGSRTSTMETERSLDPHLASFNRAIVERELLARESGGAKRKLVLSQELDLAISREIGDIEDIVPNKWDRPAKIGARKRIKKILEEEK